MIYSVPFSVPFLEGVTDFIISRQNKFALSEWTIYLPTRRACKTFEDLLFERIDSDALVLPRILPLGDMEPEEVSLVYEEGAERLAALAPVITNNRRRLLLAALVEKFRYGNRPLPFQQALIWSESLMTFLDEIRREGIAFKKLEHLIPQSGEAEHWEKIQKFLSLISVYWDTILEEENVIEAVTWQKHLMAIQRDFLANQKPESPIMIAGSLGTIPSTVDLMRVVASLKNGAIILPGFKKGKEKAAEHPHHPQFFLYGLLKKLDISADHVEELYTSQGTPSCFLEDMFEPLLDKSASEEVHEILPIEWVEASDQGEEARLIALAIRQSLEEGKRNILCISADETLLDRIKNELSFWSIPCFFSQRETYLETRIGSFIHLASLWLSAPFPAVSIAAMFKHPLAVGKKDIWDLFERHIMRAWVGTPSLVALRQLLDLKEKDLEPMLFQQLNMFYAELQEHLIYQEGQISLGTYLEKIESLITWMVGPEKTIHDLFLEGGERDKLFFQEFWSDLKKSSSLILIYPRECGDILLSLLKGQKIPSPPRSAVFVSLMTPAEARFLKADFKILAGLNEGLWPSDPIIDPFFTPSMRRTLNLPSLEGRLSQSAHDFLSYVSSGPVLLSRSVRKESVMAIPSRFLSQIKMLLDQKGSRLRENTHLKVWAKNLHHVSRKKALEPPYPLPPLEQRPKRLSVTEISTLLNDPYSIYAKHVLKLKPLERLSETDLTRLFGIFIHDFLHRWKLKEDVIDPFFMERAQFLFELYLGPLEDHRFWWQKFLTVFEWLKKQRVLSQTRTEVRGEMTFFVGDTLFTLCGIADRIDWDKEGATIIDYKTGSIPTPSDIRSGRAPQMPLEALIFLKGQFAHVPSLALKDLQYWQLFSTQGPRIISIKEDMDELVIMTDEKLRALIHSFSKAETPYLSHPKGLSRIGKYDHLSRIQEWYFQR